jgi:FkbM family methyltransferase
VNGAQSFLAVGSDREAFDAMLSGLAESDLFAVVERAKEALLGGASPRDIVIFGSSALGRLLLESARKVRIVVRAFADNDATKWGTRVEGVQIISPAEAVARFNGTAAFVIGIFNGSAPKAQLSAMGCRLVVSYHEFAWTFPSATQFIPRILQPKEIIRHTAQLVRAYAALADERSRSEFAGQVAWRCTLDDANLPPRSEMANIYFDRAIATFQDNDIIFDCGAFDGDSLRSLVASGASFRRYYAFEPDPANLRRLREYVASLSLELQERIVTLPFALGAIEDSVPFEAGRGVASGRYLGASDRVESRRIDSLGFDTPTVIKMDIEGMELDALRGASQTLAREHPLLAIAAYHYSEHLWQIPLLIKSIAPDYHIMLRRYAEECWETIFYAIPQKRLANSTTTASPCGRCVA